MLVKKEEIEKRVQKYKDGSVTVFEYGGINRDMDIGMAIISGYYPGNRKFAKNNIVEVMAYFVISGEAKVRFNDDSEVIINTGDCLYIKRNQGYQVEVKKNTQLKVLIVSNPAWSVDQYEVFDVID